MDPDPRRAHEPATGRRQLLDRLAWLTAALLLATIGLSAYMRLAQAGIGCADWPACYAESFRLGATAEPTAAESVARLAHRIVATAALALMLAMTMLAWTARPAWPAQRRLTTALLALALGLSALGVVTPGSRVPAVGMGNLLGGFAALAICARILALDRARAAHGDRHLRTLARIAGVLLVLQLATGALLSTSYAALACGSLDECQRAAAASGWPWQALDPWREPRFAFDAPQVMADGALTQWLHRIGAIMVAGLLVATGVMALRRGHPAIGIALVVLPVAQVAIGLIASASGLPLALVLLHNLNAALLLSALVLLV